MTSDLKFDVALSFSSAQQTAAEQITSRLTAIGYRVFFYTPEQAPWWGDSLSEMQWATYERDSGYCLMLVSTDYMNSVHTRHERRCALGRAMREDRAYILPLRFDDTIIPGLPADTVYVEYSPKHIDMVIKNLCEKMGPPQVGEEVLPVAATPAGFVLIVVTKDGPTRPLLNLYCQLHNRSSEVATIERLALQVDDPDGSRFLLPWRLFFSGVFLQRRTGDPQPVVLMPGETSLVGIQFSSPKSIGEYLWSQGRYQMRFVVSTDAQSTGNKLMGKFPVQLNDAHVAWLQQWIDASDKDWAELNDPDDAVGIPVLWG